MSECFCSDWSSMSNKLRASTARLYTAWKPDTSFKRDFHQGRSKSVRTQNYFRVHIVRNDHKIAVWKVLLLVNYLTMTATSYKLLAGMNSTS